MDAFETAMGYRSLILAFSLPGGEVGEYLSGAEVLALAKDMFDAQLAETLRSTGEWHWKLEIGEIVEQVAETLCLGEQIGYERLRSALLEYYEGQYRRPTAKEFITSLREKKAEKTASPVPPPPAHPCPYHADREGTRECPRCHRLYCPECRAELFLPIDPKFWVETAMMCAQCHYEVYGRPTG